MIYFDNAATTFFKPQEVINAAVNTIKNLSVNPGRAAHFLSVKGSALMWHARTSLADFFGCDDPSRVIFTSGCTHALNATIFGSNLYGKHVITTALEHNAVLRPLFELKRRGHISRRRRNHRSVKRVAGDKTVHRHGCDDACIQRYGSGKSGGKDRRNML